MATRAMRATTALLVMVAIGLLPGCGGSGFALPADESWVRATDPATQISAELPGDPEMQTQAFALPTGESSVARLWIVELGDYGAASLMVADAHGQPIDLAGALAGAAANVQGQVVEQAPAEQGGLAALDGTIEFDRDGVGRRVYLRVVDAGSSMAMLQSTARAEDGDALRQLHQRMLGSVTVPR